MSSRSDARRRLSSSAPRLLLQVFACRLELLPEPAALQGSLPWGRMLLVLQTPSRRHAGEGGRVLQPIHPSLPPLSPPILCKRKTVSGMCHHFCPFPDTVLPRLGAEPPSLLLGELCCFPAPRLMHI